MTSKNQDNEVFVLMYEGQDKTTKIRYLSCNAVTDEYEFSSTTCGCGGMHVGHVVGYKDEPYTMLGILNMHKDFGNFENWHHYFQNPDSVNCHQLYEFICIANSESGVVLKQKLIN